MIEFYHSDALGPASILSAYFRAKKLGGKLGVFGVRTGLRKNVVMLVTSGIRI
jgi:hypothetical protein